MEPTRHLNPKRSVGHRVGNYHFIKTLGKGNFSVVKLAKHDVAQKKVAIKVIDKRKIDADNLSKIHREMRIIKSLKHPHIVTLYEVIETDNMLYMIMEYAGGGEMFDRLVKEGKLAENEARRLFRQVVSAVAYCHSLGIVHRDLKAENLLLDRSGSIKVVDFGFSNFFSGDRLLSTWCGSPPYAAPELFMGQDYDGTKADVWSLGVVLYIMVSGGFPFPNSSIDKLRRSVLIGKFNIPYFVSIECADLIRKMLVVNVGKRFTLHQIIQHRWFIHPESWSEKVERLINSSLNPTTPAEVPIQPLNNTVLLYMQQRIPNWTPEKITEALLEKRFDSLYGSYRLLCDKLERHRKSDSLSPSDLDQPRRGSRGSITTGVANIDLAQQSLQISACDLAKLSLSTSPEDDSPSSSDADSGEDRPPNRAEMSAEERHMLERGMASNASRRHTVCVPGVPPQLMPPHLVLPPHAFPLQIHPGFGALQQLPLIPTPIAFNNALLNPFLDAWNCRRASDGEATPASLMVHSAGHSAAVSQQLLPIPPTLVPAFRLQTPHEAEETNIEEAGATYLRHKGSRKRQTFDNSMLQRGNQYLSPTSSYSSTGPQRPRKTWAPHVRRASSPLHLTSLDVGNLEKIYNHQLTKTGGNPDSPYGSTTGVPIQQLQREMEQLRATTEMQQLTPGPGVTSNTRASPPNQPALGMIAEQDVENGSSSITNSTPQITINDYRQQPPPYMYHPVTLDPVSMFQQQAQQIVHSGIWPPSVFTQNVNHQYYYANIPVVPLQTGPGPQTSESGQIQSIFSPCASTHIVAEIKRVLDGKKIPYEETSGDLSPGQSTNQRRLSLESDDGTKVEIGVSPVNEQQSKVDFKCVEGDLNNYTKLCTELINGITL